MDSYRSFENRGLFKDRFFSKSRQQRIDKKNAKLNQTKKPENQIQVSAQSDNNNYPIKNNDSISMYDDSNGEITDKMENTYIRQSGDTHSNTMGLSQSQNIRESSQSGDDSEYAIDDQIHTSQSVNSDNISENYGANHINDARYGRTDNDFLVDVMIKVKNREMALPGYLNKSLLRVEKVKLGNIEYI